MIHRFRPCEENWGCTALVINSDSKIVTCSRDFEGDTSWFFPSGIVDIGKSPINSVQEFLYDATGYRALNIGFLFNLYINEITDYVFKCDRVQGEIIQNPNVKSVTWEYTWNIQNYNLEPNSLEIFKEYSLRYL
jgi:hypothetical protein